MYILGISAFYHDSTASLLKDGEIIASAQEERFTLEKNMMPGFRIMLFITALKKQVFPQLKLKM